MPQRDKQSDECQICSKVRHNSFKKAERIARSTRRNNQNDKRHFRAYVCWCGSIVTGTVDIADQELILIQTEQDERVSGQRTKQYIRKKTQRLKRSQKRRYRDSLKEDAEGL